MRRAWRAVTDSWAQTPRVLRLVCVVMPLLGCAALLLGLIGDSNGFWEKKGFATNLASGLTGALFGIPFALLIISRLAAAQTDLAEERDAYRMADRVVHGIHNTALSLLPHHPADAIANARAIEDALGDVKTALPAPSALRSALIEDLVAAGMPAVDANGRPNWFRRGELDAFVLAAGRQEDLSRYIGDTAVAHLPMVRSEVMVKEAYAALHIAVTLWDATFGTVPPTHAWSRVAQQWATLEQDIRLRFFELGLPWLDAATTAKIAELVDPPNMSSWFPIEAEVAIFIHPPRIP